MKVRLLNNHGRSWLTKDRLYEVLNVINLHSNPRERLYRIKDNDGDTCILSSSEVEEIHDPIILSPEEIKQQEELFYEAAYWG